MGPDFDLALLGRLLLASLLGGVIGLEREIHGRPAGFRTHLLVSLGSCLFCITSIEFYRIFGDFSRARPIGVDPGRIAAQVVTGIGFLGAGAIIRDKAAVRGLTTAACLWVAAALGVACGAGLSYLAVCVTLIAILNLLFLKMVEKKLRRDTYLSLKVWGEDSEEFISRTCQALAPYGVMPDDAKFERNMELRRVFLEVQVKRPRNVGPAEMLAALSKLDGVKKVRIE